MDRMSEIVGHVFAADDGYLAIGPVDAERELQARQRASDALTDLLLGSLAEYQVGAWPS